MRSASDFPVVLIPSIVAKDITFFDNAFSRDSKFEIEERISVSSAASVRLRAFLMLLRIDW